MIRMKNVRFLNAIHIGSGTTFHLKASEWHMQLVDGIIWVKSKRPNSAGQHVIRGFSWNNVVSVEPEDGDVDHLFDDHQPQVVPPWDVVKPPPEREERPQRQRRRRMVPHTGGTVIHGEETAAGPTADDAETDAHGVGSGEQQI